MFYKGTHLLGACISTHWPPAGIIGTVPYYGKNSNSYNTFTDEYLLKGNTLNDISVTSVLVADALKFAHDALVEADMEEEVDTGVSCQQSQPWSEGGVLRDTIVNLTITGVSGNMEFAADGTAVTTAYDIMNLKESGFEKIGSWSELRGLTNADGGVVDWAKRGDVIYLSGARTPPSGIGYNLTGFHLKVGIVPEAPIAYLSANCANTSQSDPACWYGWSPDMVEKLAEDLHFTYEYVRPSDDKYGGLNRETQTWNGMVKDLLDKKTDMTIALAINQERSTYIDFTSSFFEDQASFIVHESSVANSGDTFFFLKPFSISVWISIICLIVLISILISCFSKISPYGKYGRKIHSFQVCAGIFIGSEFTSNNYCWSNIDST